MHRMRQHIAHVLLAVFVLGGLMAPSVHWTQHQIGHLAPEARADFAVQTAEPTLQPSAAVPVTHDLDCGLCSTHLVLKTHTQATAPSPASAEAALEVAPVAFLSSAQLNSSFIRGPPSVAS